MQRCDHAAILHGIASRRCICRIIAAVCTVHNRHCQSVVHCAQQQLYTLCTVQHQLCTLVTATAGVHSTPRVQLTAVMHTVHNCPQLCTVCTVHNRDCQSVVHTSVQLHTVYKCPTVLLRSSTAHHYHRCAQCCGCAQLWQWCAVLVRSSTVHNSGSGAQ